MNSTTTQDAKPSAGKSAIVAADKMAEQTEKTAELFSSYLSKANETLTQTASEFYKCQRDIADSMTKNWRLGIEQRPSGYGYTNLTEQLHEQSENLVANMRRMNDSFRDCGWKPAALYASSIERAAAQLSSFAPKAPAE